jgi:hypothetical protein
MYLESRLQLPKLVRELGLMSEEELSQTLGRYSSSSEFYNEVQFLALNRQLLADYYAHFFQVRNEISFVVLLVQKLLQMGEQGQLEISAYCHCLVLLGYRYCLALLEDLTPQQQLALPHPRYASVAHRFCHDGLLLLLLRNDVQLLRKEYQLFLPCFQNMLDRLQSHPVAALIQKELSGIYSHEDNEKRIIRFFFLNYLRKVYNSIRSTLKAPMLAEEEGEEGEEREAGTPALEVTVGRMIGEYLGSGSAELFRVVREKGEQSL